MRYLNILLVLTTLGCQNESIIYLSKNYCANNSSKALEIAEKKWLKEYGKIIYEEKPFKVSLYNDSIWKVSGTLHSNKGGVAYIEINAKNCKILKVTHGK